MKTIVRILILAEFAAIVFIPSAYLPRWALIPMFASMVGLVVLYWFAMFWVSRKDVIRVLGKEPEHDFYVGKLPADPNADLTRGRLCVTGGSDFHGSRKPIEMGTPPVPYALLEALKER